MTKTLDVHTAELLTAAVEVKTLTIRGKQVTLAVFRQLEESPLVAEDGTLNGVPWGRVNYHPDKCADGPAHMHVVWQDGSELRRSAVYASPARDKELTNDATTDFITAVIANELLTGEQRYFASDPLEMVDRYGWLHWTTDGIRCESDVDGRLPELRRAREDHARAASWLDEKCQQLASLAEEDGYRARASVLVEDARGRLAQAEARLAAATQAVSALATEVGDPDAAHSSMCRAVQAEKDRRGRHLSIRQALAELPQLFIAV